MSLPFKRLSAALARAAALAVLGTCTRGDVPTSTPPPVATVDVTPATTMIRVNGSVQLSATVKDPTGALLTDRPVTWTTSDSNTAKVSGQGLVTGLAAGTASIVASSESKSGTAMVRVTVSPVASVILTPAAPSLLVGASLQLIVTLKDSSGALLAGRTVQWSTTSSAIATVSSQGLVHGMSAGSATISAVSEGQTGTVVVKVTPIPVASVTLTPASSTVPVDGTVQLTAAAMDASGHALDGRTITWSVDDPSRAIISTDGLVKGTAVGTVTVTAKCEGKTGTATITIVPPPVAAVSVTPATATIATGASLQLTAVLTDANGTVLTGRTITWSTTANGVASVTSQGLVSGNAPGTATITAQSEGHTGATVITVIVPPVASVTVTPGSATVEVGKTVQLSATTKDASGNVLTGRAVTWASAAPAAATVSATGSVQAIAPGTTTVTATSEAQSGTATITVTVPAPVPVASVTVSPATAAIAVGTSIQLSATLKDANGGVLSGRAITWSSAAPGVATVSADGLVQGISSGATTITATSEGKSSAATVTVASAAVASISVAPASANLPVGGSVQLTATLKDANGNVLTGRTVTWTTGSVEVASVNAQGLAVGLEIGSTTITATSEGKTASAAITVSQAAVASVTLAPASTTLLVGGTVQLVATIKDATGAILTGRTIIWTSSNAAIAGVSGQGVVAATATGSVTITATCEGKTAAAAVIVNAAPAPVASVTVTPATANIVVGG